MKKRAYTSMSYKQEATEVASLHTQADPDYLPMSICASFLSFLWENQAWPELTGVMIILTMPVRPERLAKTVVAGDNKCVSHNQDADIVICDKIIHIPIRLRSRTIHELRLRIPDWWFNSLPGNTTQPFRHLEEDIRRLSRTFAHHYPLRPTLRRCRSSSSRLFGPGQLTQLDRGYLSGEIPGSVRAAAHYVHLPEKTLRAAWAECLGSFHARLSEYAPPGLAEKLQQPVPEQGTSGSVIEFGASSDYQVHKEILRPLARQATDQWKRSETALTQHERTEFLTRGTQAGCAYYHGLASICFALRAAGGSTEYEMFDPIRLRVHEKDSKLYSEQRLGCMSQVVKRQRDVVVRVLERLSSEGLIQLPPSGIPAFPCLIQASPAWSCIPMTAQRFRAACLEAGVRMPRPTTANFGRHIASTILYRQTSEYAWYDINGLQAGYFGADSRFSLLGGASREDARNQIDEWFAKRGLTPVSPPRGVV